MTNPIPYIVQGKNIVLVVDNTPQTITESHASYNRIVDALKAKDWDLVKTLVNYVEAVKAWTKNEFSIINGEILRNGVVVHSVIADKVINMFKQGFDVEPLLNFMTNLFSNPSNRSVTELYTFLEKGNLPITEDGCFLAYKRVSGDYYDVHSSTVLNMPFKEMTQDIIDSLPVVSERGVTTEIVDGVTVVSVPRNEVDDDADNLCSYGLHFCSLGYLGSFGGSRILIVKINPRDVVSIPKDYNQTKARCCRYEVVGEVEDNIDTARTALVGKVLTKEYDTKPTQTDGAPPKPYKQNAIGLWVDANNKFLPKRFIPV